MHADYVDALCMRLTGLSYTGQPCTFVQTLPFQDTADGSLTDNAFI